MQETDYWTTSYQQEHELLRIEWKPGCENMGWADFQAHILSLAEFAERRPVRAMLVDSTRGHVTLDEAMQRWHDREIVPRYIMAGVERMAFVEPPDLFAAASLAQTFEERAAQSLDVRFFDDGDQAEAFALGLS